jgi:predicted nucleic acid-binding protein
VIATINRRVPLLRQRLEAALVEGVTIGIPVITLYETGCGIRKSARPRANATVLAAFLSLDVTPLPFRGRGRRGRRR